jgi:O-antigen/teichoic acid export membrane protein
MMAILRYGLHQPAGVAILLRLGLLGGNLAVLLGLAMRLGLDGFGGLIVLWGLALVAATCLGFGGPLALLARLGDGAGMHPRAVIGLCLFWPMLAACGAALGLGLLWPDLPWLAVLAMAVAVNLASCLGSILRVLGSIHLSMALRDFAPLVVLGLAGLLAVDPVAILWLAALGLGAICLGAAGLVWRHPQRRTVIGPDRPQAGFAKDLWATAVLGMGLAQVDIILGGQFLTPEQIGVYALLRRLANLVALPVAVATWLSAGRISAAHAARDTAALQSASDAGARIALLPGLGLAAGVLLALPLLPLWLPDMPRPGLVLPVLLILLGGTLVQLAFAQGVSVATLTGRGHLAALARLAGLGTYLGTVALAAPLDPLGNALAYALATSLCAGLLWLWVWRSMGVDTLARPRRRLGWRMS